jgi:protein TonB
MVHRSQSQLILDQIVFETRNQAYGAYELRHTYNSHLRNSILWVMILATTIAIGLKVGLLIPIGNDYISTSNNKESTDKPQILEDIKVLPIEMPMVKPVQSPSNQYLAPKIVADKKINQEVLIPKIEDLKGQISDKTVEGIDSKPIETILTNSQPHTTEIEDKIESPKLYIPVKPSFKNGNVLEFLTSEIKYPNQAINNGVSGKVYVEFIIEKDGTISNVKALKGIGSGCDEEAERVVKLTSGMWTSPQFNGEEVRLKMIQTIFFKLP